MDRTENTRRTISICLLLAAVTLAAFWPVAKCDFIDFDDPEYVTENEQVARGLSWNGVLWAFQTGHAANWHPLTWLSHMLDVQLFGLNPMGHHLTNLVFHIANTLLLFLVLKRMTGALWRSAFVAGLFALHPLHVESVAWVSERKDVLSGFFFMLTLWAYVRYAEEARVSSLKSKGAESVSSVEGQSSRTETSAVRTGNPESSIQDRTHRISNHAGRYYALTLVLFALGLMSKPMLVTLPFVLLLLDYWPLRRLQLSGSAPRSPLPRLILEKLPFFTLAAASSALTFLVQTRAGAVGPLAGFSLMQRIANATVAYTSYLAKTLWPARLAVFYPLPASLPAIDVTVACAVLLLVMVWVIASARRSPHLIVGWLWFVVMLVPVIGLVKVGMQQMADRYTYLPLVGVFVAVVWEISDRLSASPLRLPVLGAAAGAALLACVLATGTQLNHWRDSERLFRHALGATQDNYLAHNNLGFALFTRGEIDEAIRHYETALRINPLYEDAHSNLGRALSERGKYDEAAAHFETTLRLRPDDVKAHNNLGNVLALQGKHEQAVIHFAEAVRPNPDHANAHNNLALSYGRLGRTGQAIAHYREALRSQPDFVAALNNLAWTLAAHPDAQFRNGAEAVQLATRACELTHYQQPIPLATLSAAYAEAGQFNEAVTLAERAQNLADPGRTALAARLQEMLDTFRAGRAYRTAD